MRHRSAFLDPRRVSQASATSIGGRARALAGCRVRTFPCSFSVRGQRSGAMTGVHNVMTGALGIPWVAKWEDSDVG
jgi:hypothetical protein